MTATRFSGNHDAVIIGGGPNGLAAAITLAQSGRSVLVVERNNTVGGGCRTTELTLPGFRHDVCSAIHPLGLASPFLRSLPLDKHGLEWIQPTIALAHPFDDGSAAILNRSIEETAGSLGVDSAAYEALFKPLLKDFCDLLPDLLGPLRPPHHPIALARFGLPALKSLRGLVQSRFTGAQAPALLAGMAAHSMVDLDKRGTAAFGLVLGLFGHGVGWPIPRGGSRSIVDAMAAYLVSLGGEIRTGVEVTSMDEVPAKTLVMFDLTPHQIVSIAGDQLPSRYRRQLGRFRHGPGVFKMDWALSEPVPWIAEECRRAGTLHLGGTFEEIARAEHDVAQGRHPEHPLVLVAQPSLFDDTRAPDGQHTLWAYCHVPNGSTEDMTYRIEQQIERFAPGFRDVILARSAMNTSQIEDYNPNYLGGDINGGAQDLLQLFTRPTANFWNPYATPNEHLFICSSSTPPGGGVHGMCGYHGAMSALRSKRSWRNRGR